MDELNSTIQQPTEYNDDDIKTLDWMEHIRRRPGMYIGKLGDGSYADDGIYVLLKEVLDNSIDEYMMGYGKSIEVTIEEGTVAVRDYGRGVPLGKVVDVSSKMNTGAKYDSKAFKKSVGLNGVGIKAVNALSSYFLITSYRDGECKRVEYSKAIVTEESDIQPTGEANGTQVFFVPDREIFKDYHYKDEFIEGLLKNYVFLNSGLSIIYNGKRFYSRNGLVDLLNENMTTEPLYPIIHLKGETLYEYIPDLQNCRSWQFDRMVSTVVPETDSTVVVALQNEIIRVNLTDGNTTSIAPIPDNNGKIRCNDGKCDPSGRLWIGTMGFGAPKGAASLYCVWADGTVETKLTKVTISNGIVWSANKKYMYYNDTPTRKIIRFRYDDSSGDILYDGVAVNIPEGTGSPDGMTIDCNDNLWVAQWGGGGVYCYNPYTGDLLTKIVVPAPHVASCAFGGDKLDTLYITTARAGLSEEQLEEYPLSGSVFCCKPGAKGVPANCFH